MIGFERKILAKPSEMSPSKGFSLLSYNLGDLGFHFPCRFIGKRKR
jgi:hypothetical protein